MGLDNPAAGSDTICRCGHTLRSHSHHGEEYPQRCNVCMCSGFQLLDINDQDPVEMRREKQEERDQDLIMRIAYYVDHRDGSTGLADLIRNRDFDNPQTIARIAAERTVRTLTVQLRNAEAELALLRAQ